jgi:hypothetical protein
VVQWLFVTNFYVPLYIFTEIFLEILPEENKCKNLLIYSKRICHFPAHFHNVVLEPSQSCVKATSTIHFCDSFLSKNCQTAIWNYGGTATCWNCMSLRHSSSKISMRNSCNMSMYITSASAFGRKERLPKSFPLDTAQKTQLGTVPYTFNHCIFWRWKTVAIK